MGKLAIISDLHADINQLEEAQLAILLETLQEKEVSHLHFAGDNSNKVKNCLQVNEFFRHGGIPTTFNFGNHEMADLANEKLITAFPDSHFLNDRYIPLNDGTVLLGMNGWYDYGFSTDHDLEKLRRMKQTYWYDRYIKREGNDQAVNSRELQKLKTTLNELREYRVILATHFVPKVEFIVYQTGKYAIWNQLNAFLGAPSLGELLDQYPNVSNVVFGHTHRRFPDKKINDTCYSCRPFGYYFEWQLTKDFVLDNQLVTQYNPMKLRKVLQEHRQDFFEYRNQHLQGEFEQAITLIDY